MKLYIADLHFGHSGVIRFDIFWAISLTKSRNMFCGKNNFAFGNFEREIGMRYIVSDIHGCYEQYRALLEKIRFSEEDELYILGDVVDRGPEPIKVMQDIMERSNVIFILGNHDFIMYSLMKKLSVEITEENCETYLTPDILSAYQDWLFDGGQVTAEQFRKLSYVEKMDMLDYIEGAPLYEVLEYNGKEYRLVHAGLANFSPDRDMDEYDIYELLEERADYTKRYYPDENIFLVTGHTPTVYIEGWEKPEVYRKRGHIALDCACVAGGKLAAFCVETEEIIYVDGKSEEEGELHYESEYNGV